MFTWILIECRRDEKFLGQDLLAEIEAEESANPMKVQISFDNKYLGTRATNCRVKA
jgi:hypothetical protein